MNRFLKIRGVYVDFAEIAALERYGDKITIRCKRDYSLTVYAVDDGIWEDVHKQFAKHNAIVPPEACRP